MFITMAEPCCNTFKTASLSPEELRNEPFLQDERAVAAWQPLITWNDTVGTFVVGHIAIFFCPWCGTRLPDRHEEALAEAKRSGMWIEVAAGRQVSATLDGQSVATPGELLARLRPNNNEKD